MDKKNSTPDIPINVLGTVFFICVSPVWGLMLGFGWRVFKFAAGWS